MTTPSKSSVRYGDAQLLVVNNPHFQVTGILRHELMDFMFADPTMLVNPPKTLSLHSFSPIYRMTLSTSSRTTWHDG